MASSTYRLVISREILQTHRSTITASKGAARASRVGDAAERTVLKGPARHACGMVIPRVHAALLLSWTLGLDRTLVAYTTPKDG